MAKAKPMTSRIIEEKIRRTRDESFRYYEPTGKGEEFLNLAFGGKYFITLFSAANGIGKTFSMVNALANLFWPNGNKWFQQPLMVNWPYLKRVRICSEAENVKGIVDTMKSVFPAGRYVASPKGKNYDSYFETDTGWKIWIMTYDQNPKQFEGANLGLVWQDEPPPEVIHKANVSRLRLGGICLLTATPLTGSAWMYDEIIANENREAGHRAYLEADVESACKVHGVRGFLEHEDIERMIAQYDDEDKQARVFGKFQHLIGLVFKNFNRKVHVIPPFAINDRDFTVYHELDPHPRNPDAGLWVAVNRHGQKFVVDELYFSGTTEEVSKRILRKDDQYRVEMRRIDPSAFIEDQHTQKSLADRFLDNGITYLPSSKKRSEADRRIFDAFHYVESNGQMVRAPEVYIFDTCKRLIWEIERYRWDEYVGRTKENRDPKPKPIDKDDHCIECLGRALFQEPQFTPMPLPTKQTSNPVAEVDPWA